MAMTVQEQDFQWWSDVVQTEIRLPQQCSGRLWTLPPLQMGQRTWCMAAARKIAKAVVLNVRAFFAKQPRATSTVSSADPVEAYMNACLAAPLFCYVSPMIYGLAGSSDERDEKQKSCRRGDEA
jgi:hypothetical protein